MRALLGLLLVVGCSAETICATPEALKIDPELNDRLAEALVYWEDQGRTGIVATDGTNCDVPVRPAELPVKTTAVANTSSLFGNSDCTPNHVDISTKYWRETVRQGFGVRVLAHEIGHLYCLEDAEEGVMSFEWHVDGIASQPE